MTCPAGCVREKDHEGFHTTHPEIAKREDRAEFLRTTGEPTYDNTVGKTETSAAEKARAEDRDDLFDECARLVVEQGQASTSMLQRRFRIGFSRAGRLIDLMEQDGIIGPADGARPREILVPRNYFAEVDSRQS